jgi:hypothetical protein
MTFQRDIDIVFSQTTRRVGREDPNSRKTTHRVNRGGR